MSFFKHEKALVHPDAQVGDGTRVWANANILDGAIIGEHCNIGDGCYVERGAVIGNYVTLKNGVAVFDVGLFQGAILVLEFLPARIFFGCGHVQTQPEEARSRTL